jgi:hypothetical protein
MTEAKDFEILEEDRTDKLYNRFLSKFNVESEDSCWIWEGYKNKQGYGNFKFKGNHVLAHRFSYAFFKGQIKDNLIIMHTCDCPSCVNPKHLEIGTMLDNSIDNVMKNRSSGHKLLVEEIIEIKKLLSENEKGIIIAKKFNVTKSNISCIKLNKSWKHV